jgi:2-hydroxycyclohexanecarboxyl-CoA dehydrogenase
MTGLENSRILVTGAAGGIGAAICRRLSAEGASVIATDLDAERTGALAAEIGGEGRMLDIADAAASAALAAELGPLDVLINNAGWDQVMPFLDTTPEFWDKTLRINLFGHIAMSHAFGRLMAERGRGRIVNVASDAGKVGSSGETTYAAAKGGLIAFTKSLARELARYGVIVNCVCPGPTETPLLDHAFVGEKGEKILAGMKRAIPLRRFATPDDIAGCVAFLASDDAAYMTGQAVSVDGGLVMN